MVKCIIVVLFAFSSVVNVNAQTSALPVPEGWGEGIIPFPIEFAPQIPYNGEEYVRTAPKWREPTSETLWSYCFLWWINDDAKVNASTIEQNLQAYYSGLVNRNIISRKIDSTFVFPTTASFREIKTESDDDHTFDGSVHMLDYLGLKEMTLHVQVHLMSCSKEGKLAVFFAISPQQQNHDVWKQFNMVYRGFQCN